MNIELEKELNNLEKREPLSNDTCEKLLGLLPKNIPSDYIGFIKTHSGGAFGFLGEYYIDFTGIDYFLEWNKEDNNYREIIPNIFLFASDGGGTGFAFVVEDTSAKYYELPLILDNQDELIFSGNTFNEFLIYFINKFNR